MRSRAAAGRPQQSPARSWPAPAASQFGFEPNSADRSIDQHVRRERKTGRRPREHPIRRFGHSTGWGVGMTFSRLSRSKMFHICSHQIWRTQEGAGRGRRPPQEIQFLIDFCARDLPPNTGAALKVGNQEVRLEEETKRRVYHANIPKNKNPLSRPRRPFGRALACWQNGAA